jgi:hypothetical protein
MREMCLHAPKTTTTTMMMMIQILKKEKDVQMIQKQKRKQFPLSVVILRALSEEPRLLNQEQPLYLNQT